jgi:hypothetical protein
MYTVFYGPSGVGKSTAIEHASKLLGAAVPDTPKLPGTFTAESLLSYLAQKSEERGTARGVIFNDELAGMLGGRDYVKGNAEFMSRIWDCHAELPPRFTQAHGMEVLEDLYVSMLSATNPEWLLESDPKAFLGGFGRRIIFLSEWVPRNLDSRARFDPVEFGAIAQVLRGRLCPEAFGGVEMQMTDPAVETMDEWNRDVVIPLMRDPNKFKQNYASTMPVHALKIGAILTIIEGGRPERLEAPHLLIAQRLVESYLDEMSEAFLALVATPFARLKAAIIQTVKQGGGKIHEHTLWTSVADTTGTTSKQIMEALIQAVNERKLTKEGNVIKIRGVR